MEPVTFSEALAHGPSVRVPRSLVNRGRPGFLDDAMVAAVSDGQQRSSGRSRKGRTILLVEDNADIAMALSWLLRARGHVVEVAYDGRAALAIAKRFRPRFALLDLELPAMDGYELADRLRSHLGRAAPLLVAVTGHGQRADRKRVRNAGFHEHLVKPFELEDLLAILRRRSRRSTTGARRAVPGLRRPARPAPGRSPPTPGKRR
jgi:CheY-like chemotaxis protein